MITKQSILERKVTLEEDRLKVMLNLAAIEGAIQDCDWFISQLEAEGAEAPSDTP